MVEGAVRLVYQRIYYELSKQTFFSLHQLNEAIAEKLEIYNNYRFQNRKTTRREWFEEIEKAHLDPLPPQAYLPREYRRAKVQKIGHIYSGTDKNYYSVPYRYIGMRVEVQISRELVEIFYQSRRIASHQRSYQGGHYTTVKEHMPSSHQAYNSWNPQYFAQRAEKIGPSTREYIHRLLTQYRYPEVGYKQSQGILSLVKRYPAERVEKACKRGLDYHRSSYRVIENILINKLDDEKANELFGHTSSDIPPHGNIRGADHYS